MPERDQHDVAGPPTRAELLDAWERISVHATPRRGVDHAEAGTTIPADLAATLVALLARAVAATGRPAEILIACGGGVVRDVIVADDSPPVRVMIEDADDGGEPGAAGEERLAHLELEDGVRVDVALRLETGTRLPTRGRRWTSLRSEWDRIEALDAPTRA